MVWIDPRLLASPSIALDAFAGSGTTLIAAERTGGRGYGIEAWRRRRVGAPKNNQNGLKYGLFTKPAREERKQLYARGRWQRSTNRSVRYAAPKSAPSHPPHR